MTVGRKALGLDLALGLARLSGSPPARALTPPVETGAGPDPCLWLEDVQGERALAWVRAENARTLGVLESDPRFTDLQAEALTIAQWADRIPSPRLLGGSVYNFWRDGDHIRGRWRRTTIADFAQATPAWTPVLDLDCVAKAEGANWVFKAADCDWRAERRCLVNLSDGGVDAVTVREFDLATRDFVDGGFRLPKGKQEVAWADPDTVLVSRDWTPGQLTASGYPFVVKALKRGQPLDSAREVFRGVPSDVQVSVETVHDGDGRQVLLIVRRVSFFETEFRVVTAQGAKLLALPDPAHLKPSQVFAPGPRESVETVATTRTSLIMVINQNVKGRAFVYAPKADGGWRQSTLALPDTASIDVASTDAHGERAYLSVTSFLDLTTLWFLNAADGSLAKVKQLPPKFDASREVADQYEAVYSEGTRVPYFVVHPKALALDGAKPTILTDYGGFQVSETPAYSGVLGKLWLERGGVYVLANIRGGGEFGPAWHEAGLKTHRQRIHDDFAAVAQDLIARRITSPRRLGIHGGLQWRPAHGCGVHPASRTLAGRGHPGAALRHAPLRADRRRSVVGRGVRQCLQSGRARLPGPDLAPCEPEGRHRLSRTADLDDHQGRPHRPPACP